MSKIVALKSIINSESYLARKTYVTVTKHKYLELSILISIIGVMSLQSQVAVGPFYTSIPDPVAKSQEKKAMAVDRILSVKIGLMASALTLGAKKFVVDYEKSLNSIHKKLKNNIDNTLIILRQCKKYIDSKSSIAFLLPGLSKATKDESIRKMKLIKKFKKNKIYKLMNELVKIKESDNYMTEGERKILLLDIIDKALKITI